MLLMPLVLWLATLGVAAEPSPPPELARVLPALERPSIHRQVSVLGGWALATYSEDPASWSELYHRFSDGPWRLVLGVRGGIDARGWYLMGAPDELYPGEAMRDLDDRGPACPESSQRQLEEDDLALPSAWWLTILRNEIYARHGRPFKDPDLRAYFESRPWYRADPAYTDERLSPIEKANAAFILDYQRKYKLEL